MNANQTFEMLKWQVINARTMLSREIQIKTSRIGKGSTGEDLELLTELVGLLAIGSGETKEHVANILLDRDDDAIREFGNKQLDDAISFAVKEFDKVNSTDMIEV